MKHERLSENACMKHKLARKTRVLTAPDGHRHTDMRCDRKQGRQKLRQTMTLPHLADSCVTNWTTRALRFRLRGQRLTSG